MIVALNVLSKNNNAFLRWNTTFHFALEIDKKYLELKGNSCEFFNKIVWEIIDILFSWNKT